MNGEHEVTPLFPLLAGLPRPVTQYVIADGARFIARVDLAWPEEKVAVEYDGVWHAESADQIHADRRRLNAVLGADWLVLHVTAKRLRDDFDGFAEPLFVQPQAASLAQV